MFIASIVGALRSLFKTETYGTDLENYIVSHNPKSVSDVEHLTRQYELKYLETEQYHRLHIR